MQTEIEYGLYPWFTPKWRMIFINYSIMVILDLVIFIMSSINLATTQNLSNKFIDGVCLIFSVALIFSNIFWIWYNIADNKSVTYLKRKSKLLDILLGIFIFIWYILILYLSYIFFGIHLQVQTTSQFNVIIWLLNIAGLLQLTSFLWNIWCFKKQINNIENTSTKKSYQWWPNLVYSYWLDKIYFSLKYLYKTDTKISIYNAKKIQSNLNLQHEYTDALKKQNWSKTWTQNGSSILFFTLVSSILMIIAAIFYWIYTTKPPIDLISFISIFWLISSCITFWYVHFIGTNNFQMIKEDKEDDISSNYDVIEFQTLLWNTTDHLQTSWQLSEQELLVLWGFIRKILLYNLQFINSPHTFMLYLVYGKFAGMYEVSLDCKPVNLLKTLYISIRKYI